MFVRPFCSPVQPLSSLCPSIQSCSPPLTSSISREFLCEFFSQRLTVFDPKRTIRKCQSRNFKCVQKTENFEFLKSLNICLISRNVAAASSTVLMGVFTLCSVIGAFFIDHYPRRFLILLFGIIATVCGSSFLSLLFISFPDFPAVVLLFFSVQSRSSLVSIRLSGSDCRLLHFIRVILFTFLNEDQF